MSAVAVIALAPARGGVEAELAARLSEARAASRQEAGCEAWDFHRDRSDSTLFVIVERWTSEAARLTHLEQASVAAFRRDVPPLLRAPLSVRLADSE